MSLHGIGRGGDRRHDGLLQPADRTRWERHQARR